MKIGLTKISGKTVPEMENNYRDIRKRNTPYAFVIVPKARIFTEIKW